MISYNKEALLFLLGVRCEAEKIMEEMKFTRSFYTQNLEQIMGKFEYMADCMLESISRLYRHTPVFIEFCDQYVGQLRELIEAKYQKKLFGGLKDTADQSEICIIQVLCGKLQASNVVTNPLYTEEELLSDDGRHLLIILLDSRAMTEACVSKFIKQAENPPRFIKYFFKKRLIQTGQACKEDMQNSYIKAQVTFMKHFDPDYFQCEFDLILEYIQNLRDYWTNMLHGDYNAHLATEERTNKIEDELIALIFDKLTIA